MKSLRIGSLAILAACLTPALAGCIVPQNRYDRAVSRLSSEEEARKRAEADLARTRAELSRLDRSLKKKEQSLDAQEGQLAQSKLDVDRAGTERDDAVLLVEQLRGELARVGNDLREFSGQKRELEAALVEAETRAKRLDQAERDMALKVLVMRDVSLALDEAVRAGKVAITAVEGKPAVRMSAKELFAAREGSSLEPELVGALERLATTLAPREGARVELADLSTGAATAEERIARLQKVADVLGGKGLGFERIGFAVPPTGPGATPAEKAAEPPGTGAQELTEAEPRAAAPDPAPKSAGVEPQKASGEWREGPGSVEIVIDVVPAR